MTGGNLDSDRDPTPWMVVGLGNPGDRYANTRHNIGYLVLDVLAQGFGASFKRHPRGNADVASGLLSGARVELVRSRSFMNDSGGPVTSALNYSKVEPSHLITVHDELDIPFGAIKIKIGGGDGGHNGLKSIRSATGSGEFNRVRLGIGRPPGQMDSANYVLKPFNGTERKELPDFVARGAEAVELIITQGLEAAQNQYHTK